jgi:hypothetical protein
MMTLECLGVFAVMVCRACVAGFAGLAMSYRNGEAQGQAASKVQPVHKLMPSPFGAPLWPLPHDSRNIIARNQMAR